MAIPTLSRERWTGSEFFCIHSKEGNDLNRASYKWLTWSIVLLTSIRGTHQKTNSFRVGERSQWDHVVPFFCYSAWAGANPAQQGINEIKKAGAHALLARSDAYTGRDLQRYSETFRLLRPNNRQLKGCARLETLACPYDSFSARRGKYMTGCGTASAKERATSGARGSIDVEARSRYLLALIILSNRSLRSYS